ncbi:XTP/dITP diphosphohydrolase [Micrococcales bacterium KH10]|nr:XTP/dITP diphosphohydrolase [Micrococcales bacterium KH10]
MAVVTVPAQARLLLATGNMHKLGELRAILCGSDGVAGLREDEVIASRDLGLPEPVEDGVTFEENALIKARALAAATSRAAIADDSGLAVNVLGGAPGIFSARWSGQHGDDQANLDLLLAQLADVPDAHRQAAFVCAAALVLPDGTEIVRLGRLEGTLLREPRGAGGFGYDPILRPAGETRSCAELSAAEKNAISHRGQAFRLLAEDIARVL